MPLSLGVKVFFYQMSSVLVHQEYLNYMTKISPPSAGSYLVVDQFPELKKVLKTWFWAIILAWCGDDFCVRYFYFLHHCKIFSKIACFWSKSMSFLLILDQIWQTIFLAFGGKLLGGGSISGLSEILNPSPKPNP